MRRTVLYIMIFFPNKEEINIGIHLLYFQKYWHIFGFDYNFHRKKIIYVDFDELKMLHVGTKVRKHV